MSRIARAGVLTAFVAALTLGLTACSDDEPDEGVTTPPPTVVTTNPPPTTATITPSPTHTGPTETPTVAVGDPATVGPWKITVTRVDGNLTAEEARAWDPGNDAASPNQRYVLVEYAAEREGGGTGDTAKDLDWTLIGNNDENYDTTNLVTEADAEDWPSKADQGDMVKGQAVFEVPTDAIEGSVASVTSQGYRADFPL
jgi:hypothetical protein